MCKNVEIKLTYLNVILSLRLVRSLRTIDSRPFEANSRSEFCSPRRTPEGRNNDRNILSLGQKRLFDSLSKAQHLDADIGEMFLFFCRLMLRECYVHLQSCWGWCVSSVSPHLQRHVNSKERIATLSVMLSYAKPEVICYRNILSPKTSRRK